MQQVDLERTGRTDSGATSSGSWRRRPRILVIDDNPTNIVLAKACLKSEKVICEIAPDGERGLEMALESPPDLVLLDIMLPGMDGFQVCEQLKADPRTRGVPVLMITALQELDDKIRGLRAGAEDFISKPFNRAELQARVRSLLRMKLLQEEQLESERLRVRYQMSQEADRLKDAFISIVSHEIKTPLTVMKGYVSLLRTDRKPDREDDNGLTDRIVEGLSISLAELESLMRQLLDLSRMRSGLSLLQKSEVSIHQIMARIVETLTPAAQEKNLKIELQGGEDALPMNADAEKLEAAFLHLANNAVNFTPPGGSVRIEIRETGDAIAVAITDTGIGIPPEHLSRIFEPFYQIENYMTRTVEGMGVGLCITKHVIEDHGGSIDVRSELNAGTTFTVTLPRSLQDVREHLRRLREQLLTIQSQERSASGIPPFDQPKGEPPLHSAAWVGEESR